MATFARSLSLPAGLRSVATRRLALALGSMAALATALLLSAAPAVAVVTTVNSHKYGIEPVQSGFSSVPAETPLSYEHGPVVHSNATYAIYWDPSGGAYSGEWQRLISGFLADVGSAKGALTNAFAVATQYGEPLEHKVSEPSKTPTFSTFRGAYTDVAKFPTDKHCSDVGNPCVTDGQIRDQLTKFISANGLPTGLNPSAGATPVYFIFTPPGVTVCTQGAGEKGNCSDPGPASQLCSYHSFIEPAEGLGTILYAAQPWTAGNHGTVGAVPESGSTCQDGSGSSTLQEPNQIGLGPDGEYNAGLADVIANQVAHELIATVTDPELNGWHDTSGDNDEVPDKCRNDFLGGLLTKPPSSEMDEHTGAGSAFNQNIAGTNYYLNDEFSQSAIYAPYPGVPCVNQVAVFPEFTVQEPEVSYNDVVTFNASESVVTLGIAKYKWEFGDGTKAEVNCGPRTPTLGSSPAECEETAGTANPNPVASVVHHGYSYGGTYDVTLAVTDDGGNTADVTHPITVVGPPRPSSEPSSGGSTATNQVGAGSSSGGNSGTGSSAHPSPVATQAVVSRSLSTALRSGLVVRS